jgi:D-alanyl-D-alanine carboxypeptidase
MTNRFSRTNRLPRITAALAASALAALLSAASPARATPALLVDLDSGDVLEAQDATRNWYPASISKLMTAYVALSAVREGRITLDTPMIVSARAARAAPSKMGFRPGSEITLDNALKIIMVKSANDVSITIAEGVGGSVEGFAQMMNEASARLGMTQSNWVNPNGLPDARQVTSARDMALLARALHQEFPDERGLWNIGAIQIGDRTMANHNGLIGRYPGADGMKTGFTCAAGFNVVATATRGGRRLLAVVMGQPSATQRTTYTAQLFDRGFARPAAVSSLASLSGGGVSGAPDMRGSACVRRAKGGGFVSEIEDLTQPIPSYAASVIAGNPQLEFLFVQSGSPGRASAAASAYALAPRAQLQAIPVYLGRAPGWSGQAVGPRGVVTLAKAKRGAKATASAPAVEDADSTGLRLSDEIGDAPAPAKAKGKAKVAGKTEGKTGGKAKAKDAKGSAGAKAAALEDDDAPDKAKSAGKSVAKSEGKSAGKAGAKSAMKTAAKAAPAKLAKPKAGEAED